jgi:hypothetical protein
MFLRRKLLVWTNFSIILVLSLLIYAKDDKSKNKKAVTGTPVLWRDPGNIASRDLFAGPGGADMKPDLSRVTFIKEESGGYSKKYRVRDGQGRIWVAKLSKEAQPETAATRILWAVGYQTEIPYLVPSVNIEGKGTFENVKFEARPEHVKRLDFWSWDDNPFVGTKEFQGLKVLMVLIENWDIKDDNNKILQVRSEQTGRDELLYIISDLGATFGKTGGIASRSRNEPEDYVKAKFINEVKGDYVDFRFSGKRQSLFERITIEHARWIGSLLAQLTDQQIQDAFRAANYKPEQVKMLSEALRGRITELETLPQR